MNLPFLSDDQKPGDELTVEIDLNYPGNLAERIQEAESCNRKTFTLKCNQEVFRESINRTSILLRVGVRGLAMAQTMKLGDGFKFESPDPSMKVYGRPVHHVLYREIKEISLHPIPGCGFHNLIILFEETK